MNVFRIILLVILANTVLYSQDLKKYPIEIRVYKLDPLSNYIMNVPCLELKCYERTRLTIIKNKQKIRRIVDVVRNDKNLVILKEQKLFDSKVLLEFIDEDYKSEQICLCNTNSLQKNGVVFLYNEIVNRMLIKEKLVYRIIYEM